MSKAIELAESLEAGNRSGMWHPGFAAAEELRRLAQVEQELTAENTRLAGLVYSPGLWRCAKCKLVLVQRNLNAHSGAVTARDQAGDKCPNCDVSLWRVTERENALDNYEAAERLQLELNAVSQELEALKASMGEPVGYIIRKVENPDAEGRLIPANRAGSYQRPSLTQQPVYADYRNQPHVKTASDALRSAMVPLER